MHTFADRHPQFVLEDVRVPGVGDPGRRRRGRRPDQRVVRRGAHPHRRALHRGDGATAHPGRRMGDRAGPVRRAHLRLPGRVVPAGRLGRRRVGRAAADPRGAWLVDTGADPKVIHAKASLAKLFASEAAFRCADRVVQVFGGRGYMREYAAERFFRELRVDRIWEGTSEIQRLIIARALEKRGVDRVVGSEPACRAERARASSTCGRCSRRAPIAVVGASPRGWIAETVRDNLRDRWAARRAATSSTRSTTSSTASPAIPSLADPPERPDVAVVALNPLRAAMVTRDAAAAGVPAVIIPGGGVVEGGEAAAAMQREVADIAREHGLALVGPNCMGVDRPHRRTARLHRRRVAVPAARRRGRHRPVRLRHGRLHPLRARGSASAGSSAAAPRSSSTCATTSPTASTIPRRRSVILFVEGFKRPERFLALADRALELGKPIMAVKVGRSDQAQAAADRPLGLARGRGAGHRRRARCRRGHPLRRPRRAARDGRAGRGHPPDGSARRSGPDRGRDGLDRRGVAHRRPRAAGPAWTCRRSPTRPATAILERAADDGLHRQPARPVGRGRRRGSAYGACFEAMAASGAYDVLVLVHDFPYRSLPSEVATASEVTPPAPRGDPRAARRSCRSTCR